MGELKQALAAVSSPRPTAERPEKTDEVAGLAELLGGCGLQDKLAAATAWCVEQGADSVDAVREAEMQTEFVTALALKPIPHRQLLARLGAPAASPQPPPPQPQPPQSQSQLSGAKKALLVGIGRYPHSPLTNPPNDAADMHAKLESMGFTSTKVVDCGTDDMVAAMRRWCGTIQPGDVALFFFAGHGCEYKNDNWLLSADGIPPDERDLPRVAINVRETLDDMRQAGAGLQVVLLDCCRIFEGMTRRARAGTRGLVKMEAFDGAIIGYACAPNEVAEDGGGRNGVFTQHLLQHIAVPKTDVGLLLRAVSVAVRDATDGKQRPHIDTSGVPPHTYLC